MANSIGIDWLRFSLPQRHLSTCLSYLSIERKLDFDKTAGGRNTKKFRAHLHEGIQLFSDYSDVRVQGKSKDKFILNFGGSGLGNFYESTGVKPTDILRYVMSLDEAELKRIDIAYDDYNELLDTWMIAGHLKKGACTTRWRKFSYLMSCEIGGEALGDTVYIGMRSSSCFCRIYDKMAQMREKEAEIPSYVDSWIRCELEIRDKHSNALAKELLLLPDEGHSSHLASYLRGKVDFKTWTGANRISDRESVDWWEDFVIGMEAHQIRIPKPIRSIDDKNQWLEESVAPTMALVYKAIGEDRIRELIRKGESRLTSKQKVMLMEHGA